VQGAVTECEFARAAEPPAATSTRRRRGAWFECRADGVAECLELLGEMRTRAGGLRGAVPGFRAKRGIHHGCQLLVAGLAATREQGEQPALRDDVQVGAVPPGGRLHGQRRGVDEYER
jgi:hypothetical protein